MKKIQIAAFLAIAGTSICTQTAHAAFPYAQGDVLIGFRSTNSSITTDYLIDIKQSVFTLAASNGGTVTIGNFSTDLGNFDASWFTDGTTVWGVGGANLTGDNSRTLYAGYAETSPGTTPGTTYNGQASSPQQTQLGKYNTVGTNAQTGGALIAGSTVGDNGGFNYPGLETQSQVASNGFSWASQVGASVGTGFGHFVGFEGTVGTGSPGDKLDFYKVNPSPSTPIVQGTFNIASDGTLTFTSPVPEPSTFAALAGGVGMLCFIRRRRSATA